MKIALNTVALEPVRWDADKSGALRLEDLLPAVSKAGYGACEVWQYHLTNRSPDDVPRFAQIGRGRGVRFAVVGAYPSLHKEGVEREAEMSQLLRLMDACGALGADILKIFAGRVASAKIAPDERKRSVEFLHELLDEAGGRGLIVTAETHGNTLADSPDAAEALRRELDSPHFKFCFQPFSLKDASRVIPDYERLRKHVAHVHLQGNNAGGFCLLRESVIDYRAFVQRLRQDGFDGVLSVEFVKDCHPKDRADFDMDKVVANAAADLAFIRDAWAPPV